MWRMTGTARCAPSTRACPGDPSAEPDAVRAAADRRAWSRASRLLVEPGREQVGDAVESERALEVDGLPARAYELDLHPLQDANHAGRGPDSAATPQRGSGL